MICSNRHERKSTNRRCLIRTRFPPTTQTTTAFPTRLPTVQLLGKHSFRHARRGYFDHVLPAHTVQTSLRGQIHKHGKSAGQASLTWHNFLGQEQNTSYVGFQQSNSPYRAVNDRRTTVECLFLSQRQGRESPSVLCECSCNYLSYTF